jgi:hypothetical protein
MPEVLLGKRKIHHSIVKERVRDYYNAAAAATATAAGEEKKKRREEKRREEEQAGSVFLPPAAVGIPSEEVPVFVLSSVAGKFQDEGPGALALWYTKMDQRTFVACQCCCWTLCQVSH